MVTNLNLRQTVFVHFMKSINMNARISCSLHRNTAVFIFDSPKGEKIYFSSIFVYQHKSVLLVRAKALMRDQVFLQRFVHSLDSDHPHITRHSTNQVEVNSK